MKYHLKNIFALILFFFLFYYLIEQTGFLPEHNQIWAMWMGLSALLVFGLISRILDMPIFISALSIYTASAIGVLLINQGIIKTDMIPWISGNSILVTTSYAVYATILTYHVPL